MSLFKNSEMFKEERKASIDLKQQLTKHEGTLGEVKQLFEERAPRCYEIGREMAIIREVGGSNSKLQTLTKKLRDAQQFRDRPMAEYNATLKDIRNALERAVGPFISWQGIRWEGEKKAIPQRRINEEISKVKDVEGKKTYQVRSNLGAVALFQEKLLAALQGLYSMTTSSIPEIEVFIKRIEKQLAEIDLTPVPVEQDGRVFSDLKEAERDSNEKAELQGGYPTKAGVVLLEKGREARLIQNDAEKDQSFFDQAASLMNRFK